MSDDESTTRRLSKFPTLKVEAIEGDEAPEHQDERTAMISREAIFRNSAQDRAHRRESKVTIPADETRPLSAEAVRLARHKAMSARPQSVDRTMESAIFEHTTAERLRPTAVQKAVQPEQGRMLEGTREFARNGIGTIDRIKGELEFPAHLDDELRVGLPRELAQELDLRPGELVVIHLRRVKP